MSSNKKTVGFGNLGMYNATPPVFVDGEEGGVQLDVSGNLKSILQSGSVVGSQFANFSLSATSPAAASTVAGTPVTGLSAYTSLDFYCVLTGATGGTLDIYLQTTPDGGTTWVDYAHFTQIAAAAAAITRRFSVTSGTQAALTTVGTGVSPALAANTIVGGPFGDQMRVVFVAGASTSAGAAQVIKFSGKS